MSNETEEREQNRRVEIVLQDDFDSLLFAPSESEPPAQPVDDTVPPAEDGFDIAPVADGGFDLFV